MTSRLFTLSIILMLCGSTATAADLGVADTQAPIVSTAFDWTGFYVGVQAGAATPSGGRDHIRGNFGTGDDGLEGLVASGGGAFSSDDDAAFLGGIHVGYDRQFGGVVIGGVADIGFSELSVASGAASDFYGVSGLIRQDVDYTGSARLRAGYAFDSLLVYGTAGYAFAGTSNSFDLDADLGQTVDDGEFLSGYALGGGVDVALGGKVSLGVQYLYSRFDDASAEGSVRDATATGTPRYTFRTDDTLDFHRIEAKLSYRFD